MELFNDSYEYVIDIANDSNKFFLRFYEIFADCSSEIAEKFRHTDIEKQSAVLKKSISFMINFYINPQANDFMKKISKMHDKNHLNIKPSLYQYWLDALIKTVEEYYPGYNAQVELAWRIVLSPGIAFMQHYYDVD